MFDRIGIGAIPSFRRATQAEHSYITFATIVCWISSILLLPVIPLALIGVTITGGFGALGNMASGLLIYSLIIIALIMFYVVAGMTLWSARRSIPLRLIRKFPQRKCTWATGLSLAVLVMSLLIVSVVVLMILNG